MATPAFSLQYVLTADDMRADFRRLRREYGRSWFRLAVALFVAWMAINSAMSGSGWTTTSLMVLFAMYIAVSPSPLIWLFYFWALKRCSDLNVSIEIDERSLVSLREDQKYGYRQYWSRLSRIEETDRAYELFFGSPRYAPMQVPYKAFVDDVQRDQFREFLTLHAPPTVDWCQTGDKT